MLVETVNFSSTDLTARRLVAVLTAPRDGWYAVAVHLTSGLDITERTAFTWDLRINDGMTMFQDAHASDPKREAADSTWSRNLATAWLNNGDQWLVSLKSSNAGDISVGGDVQLIAADMVRADDRDGEAIAKASALSTVDTNVSTMLTRIPAALFSGITSLASWLGIIAGKSADAGTLTEVQATTGGATYDNTTDAQEVIRDSIIAKLNSGVRFLNSESIAVSSVNASGDITVYKDEGETITLSHDGLNLTGETLRFTVFNVGTDGTITGVFELEGAAVVGGDGSTTVNLSAAETANVLGKSHQWNLWKNPDDAEDADLIARGKFRVDPALSDVD